MGTRRGELILTILRFLYEALPDLWCYCKALLATPGSLAAEVEGKISFAMLFIPDTLLMNVGRFLPTSASLLATLVESFTSLARMETPPFSIGFRCYHHHCWLCQELQLSTSSSATNNGEEVKTHM